MVGCGQETWVTPGVQQLAYRLTEWGDTGVGWILKCGQGRVRSFFFYG